MSVDNRDVVEKVGEGRCIRICVPVASKLACDGGRSDGIVSHACLSHLVSLKREGTY